MRRIHPTIVKLTLLLILLSGSLSNAEENREVISKLPSCYGADIASWDACIGVANLFGGKYTGEFKGGKRHGNGVYTNVYGEEYVGTFKDGEKHGNGALTYLNGDKYGGSWANSYRHGRGTMKFANGDVYQGEFKSGKFEGKGVLNKADGDRYTGEFKNNLRHGSGLEVYANGAVYEGGWKSDVWHGRGIYKALGILDGLWVDGNFVGGNITYANGDKYIGEYKNGKKFGLGIHIDKTGMKKEGIWENDKFIRESKVDLKTKSLARLFDGAVVDKVATLQWLVEERLQQGQLSNSTQCPQIESGDDTWAIVAKLQECEDKNRIEKIKKISLQVAYTEPSTDGEFTIKIKASVDTASLKINGEEQGGRADGNYAIKKFARAGSVTEFTIVAKDVNGNQDSKTITVQRPLSEGSVKIAALNPTQVKKQPERDAVAIVIGVAEYRNLPKAEYANEDARIFYDYAMRALGIKPENIKLLVDGDADQADIFQAFKTWLPSRVRSTTDVYVFYSGHGLPSANGQEFYLLPQRAHRDLVEETAISQSKINAAIQATKPRSVTIFLDSCYSGMARTGETLLANARPLSLKVDKKLFPTEFTVITASQADQISSSSPDLKHGIFSYYLMKGMEGGADADGDGKITLGEMQRYLVENVGRQAGMMNRKQEPQLIGDANLVLVGR